MLAQIHEELNGLNPTPPGLNYLFAITNKGNKKKFNNNNNNNNIFEARSLLQIKLYNDLVLTATNCKQLYKRQDSREMIMICMYKGKNGSFGIGIFEILFLVNI